MNQQLLTKLIEQWFDNTISDNDLACLKAELLANKEALAHYVDLTEIHSLLSQTEAAAQPQANVVPMERIVRRQRRKTVRIATFAAAALVMIGVMVMTVLIVPEKQHGLTFDISPSTQFILTHSSIGEDAPTGMTMLEGSQLVLSQGTVELTFGTGVKSIVMAPADMTLHEDNKLYLNQGTAWFQVPEGAEGFQVTTQNLDIVDLGTEFGVITNPDEDGQDEVHVFKGKVEVTSLRYSDETITLTADQARSYDPVGSLEEIQCTPEAFLASLPDSLPYIHWSFDKEDDFKATGTHPVVANISTTAVGSPTRSIGKVGTALELNGTNQHLETDWQGFSGQRPRTVSFWIKIPDGADYSGDPGIVAWGDRSQGNQKWKVAIGNKGPGNQIRIRLSWGNVWLYSQDTLDTNQWHHIIVTSMENAIAEDIPTASIYIDGRRQLTSVSTQGKGLQSGPISTNTSSAHSRPLLIGSDLYQNLDQRQLFDGLIDEIYIFDGYMTDNDVEKWISSTTKTNKKTTYN